MLHINNTSCFDEKKSMPSRSKIAYYWREASHKYFDYLMDWGEPSCWGCGTFNGKMDIEVRELYGFEIFKVWGSHNYLQRCHIVPKALGGCNCEANLVLLCHRCHKASPDTRDPIHFVNWVRNKKKNYFKEIINEMTLLEYTPEENDWKLLISRKFKEYYNENSVAVGGITPLSTLISCFLEFKGKDKL
jgi:5-methylcytosine-specific restriction endonuclease McrA